MDKWEKFNETSLPEKKEFYSNLTMENIADADYIHAKRVSKYHHLYLTNVTLLLADVFENVRKICLKIHHLDSTKVFSAPDQHDKQLQKRLK